MTKKIKEIKRLCKGLDGLLVTDGANVSYLSGFTGSDSSLLVDFRQKRQSSFITDSRYIYQAKRQVKSYEIKLIAPNRRFFTALTDIIAKKKLKRLGFEAKSISFGEIEQIKKRLKSTLLIPTYGVVESLRSIKSKSEIELIKKAVRITESAFKFIQPLIKPGVKESELAAKMELFMKQLGAASSAFLIIVASGKNSAWCHAPVSSRKIKVNEAVLIDAGANFKGYNSDLTRVYFLGRINPTLQRCLDVVIKAKNVAIKAIKPGVRASKIDKIARDYIASSGFGKYFLHSLGHGIGRCVHEAPTLSTKSQETLKPGMVFTVEPGIYLPACGGVRIEDMVLVTKTGHEVLSQI